MHFTEEPQNWPVPISALETDKAIMAKHSPASDRRDNQVFDCLTLHVWDTFDRGKPVTTAQMVTFNKLGMLQCVQQLELELPREDFHQQKFKKKNAPESFKSKEKG